MPATPMKESHGGGRVEGVPIHSRARKSFANNPRTSRKGASFIRTDQLYREACRERRRTRRIKTATLHFASDAEWSRRLIGGGMATPRCYTKSDNG
jgi:hypothetical protein